MIAWEQHVVGAAGQVTMALTDRGGGRSRAPFDAPDGSGGLNLAAHVGDDLTDVEANRAALAATVGVASSHLVLAEQVHGSEVVHVTGPWQGAPARADAMVTTQEGLALVVLVADCVPVLLAAADDGIVAVAHAGRPGMAEGVVPNAVDAMRDLGAADIQAWLGPSVCPRCYEVPFELREQVAGCEPSSRSVTWEGTPAIDVAAGVLEQLRRLGVRARQRRGCTVESPDLFSYRRDGRTGRFAGLVGRGLPGPGLREAS